MTKKEQAKVDAMVSEYKLMAAMRWTDNVKPDVPPPTSSFDGKNDSKGWSANGFASYEWASQAWSGSTSHGTFQANGNKPPYGSQGSQWLYSKKSLALKAARHQAIREIAEKLAAMDEAISKAETEEAANGQ